MNTPQPQIKSPQESDTEITARDLFLALEEKRNDFKVDRWNIISEIVSTRERIEMYEGGSFGPSVCPFAGGHANEAQIRTQSSMLPTLVSDQHGSTWMGMAMKTSFRRQI